MIPPYVPLVARLLTSTKPSGMSRNQKNQPIAGRTSVGGRLSAGRTFSDKRMSLSRRRSRRRGDGPAGGQSRLAPHEQAGLGKPGDVDLVADLEAAAGGHRGIGLRNDDQRAGSLARLHEKL